MPESEIFREGHFHFDPQDPIYAEHFPGQPVVPGSLIIEAFRQAVRKMGAGQRVCSVGDFRFRRFIAPGRYVFRMQSNSGGCTQCTLFDNDRPVVTGILRERV